MAISDELWLLAVGLAFNYLIVYKNNKFFGNIAFILMGLSILIFTAPTNMTIIMSALIFLGGLISLIYDFIN